MPGDSQLRFTVSGCLLWRRDLYLACKAAPGIACTKNGQKGGTPHLLTTADVSFKAFPGELDYEKIHYDSTHQYEYVDCGVATF